LEIIVVRGNQPSLQRNKAVQKAKGEIIYFLDNDSFVAPSNLKRIIDFFNNHPQAAVSGGPSLVSKNEKFFGINIATALSSFFGSAKSYARYNPVGKLRKTTETELILCNMAFKKDIFIKSGMFNEQLYPNEENELLNRIKDMGYEIWYDPELVVYRHHRENIPLFIKQIFNYGRGRAEQTLTGIKNLTLFPIVSLGFDIYLILIFILPKFFFLFYLALNLLFTTIYSFKKRSVLYTLPIIYLIIHTFYGIGFFYGIVKNIIKPAKSNKKVWFELEIIK